MSLEIYSNYYTIFAVCGLTIIDFFFRFHLTLAHVYIDFRYIKGLGFNISPYSKKETQLIKEYL